MSFLARLFRPRGDDRRPVRALWFRSVELARDPRWYAQDRVADTIGGRFDMITLVFSLVLIRLEREGDQGEAIARLTELFVEDMEAQLRENGIGDVVVGKHMGRLMSVLGGRLGGYREGLEAQDKAILEGAIARNVTLEDGAAPGPVAERARHLFRQLEATPVPAMLAAEIRL